MANSTSTMLRGRKEANGDTSKEETYASSKSSKSDAKFDETIGHIEEIILDEKFQNLQSWFFDKFYAEFDDAEENRLIYTDIHKQYIELIEKYLEGELTRLMPQFNMEEFQQQLLCHKKELDGLDVLDVLLTFSDFLAFKELILSYKAEKEGRSIDSGLVVRPLREPSSSSLSPISPDPLSHAAAERRHGDNDRTVKPSFSSSGPTTTSSIRPVHVDMMDFDELDSPRRSYDSVDMMSSLDSERDSHRGAESDLGCTDAAQGNDLGLCLFGKSVKPPGGNKR